MAEFDDLRKQLRQARAQRDDASDRASSARERLKRIKARMDALDRAFGPNDPAYVSEIERLETERVKAEGLLNEARHDLESAKSLERGLFDDFTLLANPSDAIAHLKDQFPILLFPVRLETRFKTVTDPDTGESQPQLWVRIYPDDCSIDTFEPTLSEAEIANARLYWTSIWEAGGIEDQERGAWRALVAGHSPGRARWIVSNYKPLNLAQKPGKALPGDVVLTIPTEAPLTPDEQKAAVAFWPAVWLADGNRQAEDDARKALEQAVGSGRAARIIADYRPANFADKPAPPLNKQQVNVSAAFLELPQAESLDLKRHSWSQAPKAVTLPDRFVFIGYPAAGEPVIKVGNAVPSPLVVGPDPSTTQLEQLRQEGGEIVIPEPMKWMVDFDRAVEVGMGFRINLDGPQSEDGFERVLVVGLRLNADAMAGKAELETLIEHHYFSRAGFSLLPQGTPTNNTEAVGSGFTRVDDSDESFDDLKQASLFEEEFDWLDKKDGQWLAEYLGIDAGVLKHVNASGGRDQADARAMNTALWPATLGYWMESMMSPVFTQQAHDQTREFFNRFVLGRGVVPAVRIGKQPYGILPATALSRMRWMEKKTSAGLLNDGLADQLTYLQFLYSILLVFDQHWRQMAGNVSFAGKAGDAHKTLLDIVGLHAGSVEFSQRIGESAEQVLNRLTLQGLGGFFTENIQAVFQKQGVDLLAEFGYIVLREVPEILKKYFFGKHNLLKGPVVDDKPLSETDQLRAYAADGKRNYIEWLIDAANTSINSVYAEAGFLDNKSPQALLYLMLRHALQLGYHDTSVRLHESFGLLNPQTARLARRDDPFIHIRQQAQTSESRYQLLYKAEPVITKSATVPIGEFIASSMSTLLQARYLREQVQALERLKHASTARLERAFTEHIDCCSYRLDAWLLGLVHFQLAGMRNLRDRHDAPPRKGIYLGAYAWLEQLRPENKVLTPVALDDPGLAETFAAKEGEAPLERDSANQGYIHAPSLNQAVAAAVLRNGYISNARPENRQTMAVNLTSERVRTALAMIEGIRGGQSLGALLGYQFERGLHDRHGLAEVDQFILDLRKEFPLHANRMASTRPQEAVSIDEIEARNVIDGLALVNHIKATNKKTYPFDKPLPPIDDPKEAAAINAEADRLLESHDAVADLALAEGVYQAVLGNYDRVASTYDAYSKGNFPPEPQVVRTPASGFGLTHRVGLHLEAGLDPTLSPVPPLPMTPRAQAEPAINSWLAKMLPPLGQVACRVRFRKAATNAAVDSPVTLFDLGIQPADLLHIVRNDDQQAMSEMDDRILRFVVTALSPRPDEPIKIFYMDKMTAGLSIFELMPLMRHLRRLTTSSRPLKPSDLALVNEATSGGDEAIFVDEQRLLLVRKKMDLELRPDLAQLLADLEGPLADLPNRRDELINGVDVFIDKLAAVLARTAEFAVPQTGWGFAYDFKRRVFRAILEKCAELVTRWGGRLDEFDGLMLDYMALPATATDQEKFEFLTRAEHLISTAAAAGLFASPDDFKTHLETVKRPAFSSRLSDFDAIRNTNHTSLSLLLNEVEALSSISAFDLADITFAEQEDEIVRFAQDAASVVRVVLVEIDRRLASSQALLAKHAAASEATARVKALEATAKALLGDDFLIVPEFNFAPTQAGEVEKALGQSLSGSLFKHLVDTLHMDFPVDTWLYGVARVREKMRDWEQVVMLAGGFGNAEPELTPLQLPFVPDDNWLALEFPLDTKLDRDRLLYTAHFSSLFQKASRQCGLLLDEWAEVVPARDATTAVTFHYDRPNCEAPQTMLLVTPTDFRGSWQWDDLIDALNETLDFAKRRAVEPVHVDSSRFARFLPATVMALTMSQLTISANLAFNNSLVAGMKKD
jgi:hypothetical protein